MADYLENIEKYPVKSLVKPKEVMESLPSNPPLKGEDFSVIFQDFEKKILKGMTHWQHPSFFAYFPANSSFPSILAEMLTATMGAQCMIWDTSPAAAELEELMMEWLKEMLGLPSAWVGSLQDTASTATLCAILTAREKMTDFNINEKGFSEEDKLVVYCSTETHSSVEKAAKIAGIGKRNVRKIGVDAEFAMRAESLEKAIRQDVEIGLKPAVVVATIGTTSSTAIDPVRKIGEICKKYGIWLHVDAAYAGTASILPELRNRLNDGLELADSYVFNPHKWMMTNFDCTVYYVKSKEYLIRTFEILPEYLKTKVGNQVNNYRDWGIQLGRRFRALKLWFVIRTFGVEGIREKIRRDLQLAQTFKEELLKWGNAEILAPILLNLVCFRLLPQKQEISEEKINALNQQILESINQSGKAYLTHTKLNGKYVIRAVFGQTNVGEAHVLNLLSIIKKYFEDYFKNTKHTIQKWA
ncbi:MAG: aspartate aminotransferase family protein [Flammeovirgaceae bacterium]